MAQQPPETSGMGRPVSLSLVIPCYNEEKTLAACVERCLALREHGIRLELLIVDDCIHGQQPGRGPRTGRATCGSHGAAP